MPFRRLPDERFARFAEDHRKAYKAFMGGEPLEIDGQNRSSWQRFLMARLQPGPDHPGHPS